MKSGAVQLVPVVNSVDRKTFKEVEVVDNENSIYLYTESTGATAGVPLSTAESSTGDLGQHLRQDEEIEVVL